MKSKAMCLSTGDFAKLCNVSKHTLFHYHKIGIFSPEHIDEKGYRYYNVLQFDSFSSINQLCSTGMSLSEIKNYLNNRSPQKMINLCVVQEVSLDKKIEELQHIKQSLSSARKAAELAIATGEGIIIARETASSIILSKVMDHADDIEMTKNFGDLVTLTKDSKTLYTSGMLHRTLDLRYGNNKNCFRFYLQGYIQNNCEHITRKPEGNYLIKYHFGGYEKLNDSYKKIFDYADKNRLRIGEFIYQEIVIGDWGAISPEEYVLKLSVLITSGGNL